LCFLGKEDQVSDHFGEKLSEPFVASVLERVFKATGITTDFALLAIDECQESPVYTLYVETQCDWPGEGTAILEMELCRNPHYDYCRRIGQLGAAKCAQAGPDAYARYSGRLTELGMRLGDIKPASLSSLSHWRNWLIE